MIEEIKIYKCNDCGKTYQFHPGQCKCEKLHRIGKVVGCFTLEESIGDSWKVKCNYCTNRTTIHVTNLNRQKSCGCVPKTIIILDVKETSVRYKCKKCQTTSHSNFPIIEWCCENNI